MGGSLMEEKYLPINEENFFAVQLILRTKTEVGNEPIWNAHETFMEDFISDFLHPECWGKKYVLTSSSSERFCPAEQNKALPLKVLFYDINGVPSIEEIKPVFYKTCKEGFAEAVELKEEEEYETI